MNGLVNINKPQGITSRKVVNIMQRLTGIRKIGHAGTLDPMAEGVLPICIGTATRLVEYMETDYKTYEGELKLGIKTDTQDIWGTVIKESTELVERLSEAEIRDAFFCLKGTIMQTPPLYSAVKVAGRRLYEYARNGETVQVQPRPVHIKRIKIDEIRDGNVSFQIECSKGTYIRTICNDVGERLGCGAAMSRLVRTKHGAFQIKDALTLEEVGDKIDDGSFVLLPLDFPLSHIDKFEIRKQESAKTFVNGGYLDTDEVNIKDADGQKLYRAYYRQVFIGMAKYIPDDKKLKAHKVFCRNGL